MIKINTDKIAFIVNEIYFNPNELPYNMVQSGKTPCFGNVKVSDQNAARKLKPLQNSLMQIKLGLNHDINI
jgi:hypothetical protein